MFTIFQNNQKFMDFFNGPYRSEMEQIERHTDGLSSNERGFQKNKKNLDYFGSFLPSSKGHLLNYFKDSFYYLTEWEKSYKNEDEKADKSKFKKVNKEYFDKRLEFRTMTKSFINYIINLYFMFNRDDNEVGVYSKYKKHKKTHYSLEALEEVGNFVNDYSRLLIRLITNECQQGVISYALFELIRKTPLDRLKYVCTNEWYDLGEFIDTQDNLQPSPVLVHGMGKLVADTSRDRSVRKPSHGKKQYLSEEDHTNTLKNYFRTIINKEQLIANSAELTGKMKNEEIVDITGVIKGLLKELREGDEITVNDAIAVIQEDWKLKYLTTDELTDYFKNLLIDLPDFEYIRLKKSFRRKSSSSNELLTNIDSVMKQVLDQTKQLQELLESQFDLVLENQEQIQDYLFEKLGSDFEKIKHLWVMYQEKEISSKTFIQESTKILGLKFTRIFTNVLFLLK